MAAIATMAVGCSLLVPLDYTGGSEPAKAGRAGGSGAGAVGTGGFPPDGTLGEGGITIEAGQPGLPEGGVGNEGVGGGTSGTDNAGGETSGGMGALGGRPMGGSAGTGDVGGGATGGDVPMGGTESAGTSGTSGGVGGRATGGKGGRPFGGRAGMGGGGMGGMSGSSVAGNANCPDADLSTDPANCGRCAHACADGVACETGLCITAPCVGLTCATTPVPMPTRAGEGYKVENMGKGDICYEVLGYAEAVAPPMLPSIIAWNFSSARKLEVNGVTVPQTMELAKDPGVPLLMPERGGGYCVHATSGDYADAGLKLPLPAEYQP